MSDVVLDQVARQDKGGTFEVGGVTRVIVGDVTRNTQANWGYFYHLGS